MCGYCTEETALKILKDDIQGSLQMKDLEYGLARYFYLRETPEFIPALDSLRRSLAQERSDMSSDIPPFLAQKKPSFFSEVPPAVLLYRGLEILLVQGFASPAYQLLLKKPLYREAISFTCSDEKRNAFELATEGLEIEHLGMLYDAETYFWGERSKQLRTLAHVLPSCRNLLKHYISWWLEGKDLKKDDMTAAIEERDVTDPINVISDEDRSRFDLLCRALYFSILMVGSCSAGKKILKAIVQRNPAGTPGMEGEDIWLQRVAAVKLYDLEGFTALSKYLTTIRATHYYYIDIVRSFTVEQKELLLGEIKLHPNAETTDNLISLSRWLGKELGMDK